MSISYSNKSKLIRVKKSKIRHSLLPHFRLLTLSIYFIFIVSFNLLLAPILGIGSKVEASSIDPSRLVYLANQDRTSAGLAALTVDQRLINAATNKAIDMLKKQYWSHYGPNGETPWQFIIGSGYSYTYAGENLAKDFTDTDTVNTAWMNSATHRANIMNVNYQNIGIAAVSGKQICNGTYPNFSDNNLSTCNDTVIIVQMFGTLTGSPPISPPAPTQTPVTKTVNILPRSISNPIPVITPILAAPSVPVIQSPQNNAILNQSKIEIKGTTDENTSISIYDGSTKVGTVLSSGSAFDVKDVVVGEGEHQLKANAKKSGDSLSPESALSLPTKITIDTIKPQFDTSKIKLQLNDQSNNEYIIEGSFTPDTVKVKAQAGTANVVLEKKENNVFGGTIKVPPTSVGIVLSAFDAAGNEYDEQIGISSTPLASNISLSAPIASPHTSSDSFSSKQLINVIIGIVLLGIFAGDSILVWKSGHRTYSSNITSHYLKMHGSFFHHIIPMMFVIVSLFATLKGTVI